MASELDILQQHGFTKRMARAWIAAKEEERASGLYSDAYLDEVHAAGFLAGCARSYDADRLRDDVYLSDYDHFRLWPLNPWQRIWINDKLTLYYILEGTKFGKYLPEYFFYSTPEGTLQYVNEKFRSATLGDVLREYGNVACKPCNGTGSEGFFHLSWRSGAYFINGNEASEDEINAFAGQHPNYVFTEFLIPEKAMGAIDPRIHTLRTLVINPDGKNPFIAGTYLRFGMEEVAQKTGAANYTYLKAEDDRDYVSYIDPATGAYGNGKLVYATHIEDCPAHPDSGITVSGTIACWDEVASLSLGIANHLPLLRFMGFDIGITDQGPKIMEINSHPGVHYVQLFTPLMDDGRFRMFVEQQNRAIEDMTARSGMARWNLVR